MFLCTRPLLCKLLANAQRHNEISDTNCIAYHKSIGDAIVCLPVCGGLDGCTKKGLKTLILSLINRLCI